MQTSNVSCKQAPDLQGWCIPVVTPHTAGGTTFSLYRGRKTAGSGACGDFLCQIIWKSHQHAPGWTVTAYIIVRGADQIEWGGCQTNLAHFLSGAILFTKLVGSSHHLWLQRLGPHCTHTNSLFPQIYFLICLINLPINPPLKCFQSSKIVQSKMSHCFQHSWAAPSRLLSGWGPSGTLGSCGFLTHPQHCNSTKEPLQGWAGSQLLVVHCWCLSSCSGSTLRLLSHFSNGNQCREINNQGIRETDTLSGFCLIYEVGNTP